MPVCLPLRDRTALPSSIQDREVVAKERNRQNRLMTQQLLSLSDDPALTEVETALRAIPDVGSLIREAIARAVDEVVDPIRSARWEISQLDQPEKTTIGIKVENMLRIDLALKRSKLLDLEVAGHDVDVKFSISEGWMIPPEAVGQICLLTSYREADRTASAGLLRTTTDVLNTGANRDGKRSVQAAAKKQVRWLVRNEEPELSIVGFMASIGEGLRDRITDPSVGAQERVNRLFTSHREEPIPEVVVEAVAQHRDWTRRLRPDTSNPKGPEQRGYEVFRASSAGDRRELAARGIAALKKGHCIALSV